jgi:hypothetical protein
MADELTGTYTPTKRALHEAGSFAGVCCDFLNLGFRKREDKTTGKPYLVRSVAYVVFAGEHDPDTGKPLYLSREFDERLSKKAAFRKFLESWRGKEYTDDELHEGIPYHKAVGRGFTVTVVHNESKGNTYANIESIKPLAKGLVAPEIPADFARAEFWQKVKEKYAAEVVAYEKQYGKPGATQSEEEETPF